MPEIVLTSCVGGTPSHRDMPSGLSVRDVCRALVPSGANDFSTPTIALLNGEPVLRRDDGWETTILSESCILIFVTDLPQGGGGSSSGRLALQAVVTAVAIAATWYLGGSGGALASAGWSTGAANFTAGMVSAGIMMLGSLAISAIYRQSQGQTDASSADSSSPTYSINATGNMARLNQPEPEQFGRIKSCPDYVFQTWTQYQDGDQYGHFVFGVGRGEMEISALYFDDTIFWKNGQPVYNSGYVSESGVNYSHSVASILPVAVGSAVTPIGPIDTVEAFDRTRTIYVNLTFPSGLCTWTGSRQIVGGDRENSGTEQTVWTPADLSVTLRCEVRQIDNDDNVVGDWVTVGEQTVTTPSQTDLSDYGMTARSDAFSSRLKFRASKYLRWQVRVTNLTAQYPDATFSYTVTVGNENNYETQTITETKAVNQEVRLEKVTGRGMTVIVEILPPNEAVTIFPTNVCSNTEVSGQELYASNDPDLDGANYIIGPFAANAPGTTTSRVSVDVAFTQGLGQYDSKGVFRSYSVTYTAEYQYIDDEGNVTDSTWHTLGTWTKKNATTSVLRYTHTASIPAGRVQVRMRRTTSTDTSTKKTTLDSLSWTGLKSFLPGKLTCNQTTIAVKIKATNALSSSASRQFHCLATRKLPLYNRTTRTWSDPVATRSWAAAVSSVLKASYGGQLTDDQIDLDTLWSIDATLQARGWYFDAVLDGSYNVWALIQEMCQCQLVLPRFEGTVLSFVHDVTGRPVRFALNPRNIIRGSFKPKWNIWTSDTTDDVTINYLDEEAGYAKRDVTASLTDSDSIQPTSLDWIGITNRDHAFRCAVGYAARNRHRRVTVELQTEGIGHLINVGDVVTVAHPRLSGTAAGKVEDFSPSGLSLTLKQDFEFTPVSGTTYYLSMSAPDGSAWGPVKLDSVTAISAVFNAADYASLIMSGQTNPFNWISDGRTSMPTTFTIHKSKLFSRRMLVQSITVDSMYKYSLVLCNDATEIDNYDSLTTPVWQGRRNINA